MYGATNTGIDEFGACSAGVRILAGSTIGSRDNGAVCKMSPPFPSWIPRCVSRISGCEAAAAKPASA
ncbi:hypothetical protein WL18_20835 [Burkholderia ubonensis]|nr:hypothetical protein WL18_20835 [Burkholderia ubonensis]